MNLKMLRTDRGLSQKIVADAIGCSVPVYSRYETGARQPSLETLICLADFYGITLDELAGRIPMKVAEEHKKSLQLCDDEIMSTIMMDEDPHKSALDQMIRKIVQQEFEKRGM